MFKSCVGSPGNGGVFCPLHQTSVVFMYKWVACWDGQSGPMGFGLGDTKISFKPPPTPRVDRLYVLRKTVNADIFLHWLAPAPFMSPKRFITPYERTSSVVNELSYFCGGTMDTMASWRWETPNEEEESYCETVGWGRAFLFSDTLEQLKG